MTTQDRIKGARAYLAKLPLAISGQGGHPATYRAASILAHGFDLSYDDAWTLLQEWNTSHCSPPWSEKELRHKLNDAFVKPHEKPKGWLKSDNKVVGSNGRMMFDPKRPAPVMNNGVLGTADLLLAAFKDDEYVCITNEAGQSEDGRYYPASKGSFLTRSEWITRFFGPDAKNRKHYEIGRAHV